jgi:predicted oxidoreductase
MLVFKMPENRYKTDVVIVGGGLAGISAAIELLDRGKHVLILDRDVKEEFGGLARWSFGGICMINTPEQKRMGIKDNPELALRDWSSFAQFEEDAIWPKKWAKLYTESSIEMIYEWLKKREVTFLSMVNWPERGLFVPGNSVPRWHITWGTGHGLMESLINHLENHPNRDKLKTKFGHRVNGLISTGGRINGCKGVLDGSENEFEAIADGVIVAAGGICGDLDIVKKHWYKPWGDPPEMMLTGSHQYANGDLHYLVEEAGGNVTHMEKQFHYAAGIHHPNPRKPNHGLSLIPPKSALWVNAIGKRIGPVPLITAYDTRYMVEQICKQPGGYSWQILNRKIMERELAVSGSEYMTDFRDKKKLGVIKTLLFGNKPLTKRLLDESIDIVTAESIPELALKMNQLHGDQSVDKELLESEVRSYDENIGRGKKYMNDDQLRRIAHLRQFMGDRLRTCKFQRIDDSKAYPLIAIREFILARKSLGGIQTDLNSQVLNSNGDPIPGLYAAGEAAGFGGGGIHGLRSLEGTFLGGCILTGRIAGREIH